MSRGKQGISPQEKKSVEKRRTESSKAHERNVEALMAKKAVPPELKPAEEGYIRQAFHDKGNGSRIQVLDTMDPDAPGKAAAPERFAVQCLTHGSTVYFDSVEAASRAARSSGEWCRGCAQANQLQHHS